MDLPQFRPNVAPRTSPIVNEIISSPSPSSSSGLPHAVIAIVCILGAAVLLLAYRSLCEKLSANRRGRSFGRSLALSDRPDASLWPIMITRGLQESVIRAIPVFTFSKNDGLVDGCECAVCLCEFEEEESLRLLPKCSHAFHLPCIDQWLQSHSNCPLCRANILSPSWPPSPPTVATPHPPPQENAAQSTNQARNYEAPNSGRPAQQNSDQQRCPADRCSPNTRQSTPISVNLTMREQLGPRKAPNTFDREGNRCANQEMPVGSSCAFRCYSTGRALNLERMPDGDQTRDASGSMMRRSCSFFSYDRQEVVGNMTEIADVKNAEVSQNYIQDIEAEDGMVLQIGKTDSSSDDGRDSKDLVTERSELDENNEDEKCKEEILNDKMLGCRPTVKRSFSAGRLLGLIMMKNSDNIRLPI